MKKNFFKKLSFVLAFAMVLSVLAPASGVFAAKAPKLNATNKYLHLGRAESGENEFNFNIVNKGKGWKYAWTSSNKKVATVNAKNGVVTAKGAGPATITVKITDKDGKKVQNLKTKVTVRDNITEVAISNPLEDGKKLGVGEAYDFNRSYETEAGLTKGSKAVTRWTVEQDGKVSETATIDDKGVFVAEAAGEYEIVARSFQSLAKYNAWVKDAEANADNVTAVSEAYKVEVAASIVDVKQVNTTKVDVTFDTDVSKEVTKDNLKVESLIGSTKVNQLVKEVKFNEAGTVATVEMYVAFTGETKYIVSYKETEGDFVAAKIAASEVAKVELTFDTLEYAKGPKTLDFKLTNANGVDITTPALKGQITVSLEGEVGFLAGNDLYLNKGETAVVNMVFHTYNYDEVTFEEHVVKGTAVVRAVEENVATLGKIDWTLTNETDPAKIKWDEKDRVNKLAAEDRGYKVVARAKMSDDDKTYAEDKFTFASSDDNVLIVDTYGTVYPVKQGGATIIISYDGVVKEAVNVSVVGKRVVSEFRVDGANVINITNSTQVEAEAQFKLIVKDQLGADWNGVSVTVEEVPSGNPSGKSPIVEGTYGKEIDVVGNGAGKGSWRYLVKGHDRQLTITVNVQEPTLVTSKDPLESVTRWALTVDNTTVDTAVSNDKIVKNVTPTLIGYASNGVACYKADFTNNSGFYYELSDNKGVYLTDEKISVASITSVSGSSVSGGAVSGGAVEKMKKGSYIITAYGPNKDGKTVILSSARFTVVDTTTVPTYSMKETTVDAGSALEAVKAAFNVSFGDNAIDKDDLSGVTFVYESKEYKDGAEDHKSVSGNLFVKSVKFSKEYTQEINGQNVSVTVEYTVDINRTIYVR